MRRASFITSERFWVIGGAAAAQCAVVDRRAAQT
jgi:hypothetical protein